MIHADLFRVLIPAGIISVGCAIFGWIGLLSPVLLGWPASNPLIVKILLGAFVCMPLLWFMAFRLHLRSLWVYRNTKPIAMNVQVKVEKDSEGTSYYALLRSAPDSKQIQRIPVYPPRWDPQFVATGISAQVFVDPVSGKPLVIEINGKRLWTMALSTTLYTNQ